MPPDPRFGSPSVTPTGSPAVLPSPGPPPRPPVIPSAEMTAVRQAIEELVDVADASRRIHEDSVRTTTDITHFEGAAATTFRTQLVGQLRRLRTMVVDLEAGLDVLAAAQRTGRLREEAHVVALRAHREAVSAYRNSIDEHRRWTLAQGLGPREPPDVGRSSSGPARWPVR